MAACASVSQSWHVNYLSIKKMRLNPDIFEAEDSNIPPPLCVVLALPNLV